MSKYYLFLIIIVVLISIWFGPKKLLAHAEDGIPFYNLFRTSKIYSSIWHGSNLGVVNPFDFSRYPFYKFISQVSFIDKTGLTLQYMFFLVLILTPLVSIPALVQELFPNSSKTFILSAGLFYLFNLFVLTQVFQRFIYSLMFLWSFLPLFLYLWIKWLGSKKPKYLIYFLVANFVFSPTYLLISSVFALWIPAGILWLRDKHIFPAIVGIFFWVICAIWWWGPLATIKDNPYIEFLNPKVNMESLVDVSKFYPSSEIFLLKQRYYFRPEAIWSQYYSQKPIYYISQLSTVILGVGVLYCLIFKKNRLIVLWLFIGWFLIKGANPPWGEEFYSWIFDVFPFTMVLRNPYEKLGAMFLLPYSMLMAKGLSLIPYRSLKTIIVFIICFILLRPMWTGQVFAGYQIEVPDSYREANKYLNSQSNFRILHLPFLHGAGTSYTWGYSGEEPSSFLFDRPSVSGTYFSVLDPYLYIYKYLRFPKIYRLFQHLAIDTVVVHNDTLPGPGYQEGYADSKALLDRAEKIQLTKSFDDLDIYQLNPDTMVTWGYLTNQIYWVPTLQDGFEMVVNNPSFTPLSSAFVTSSANYGISQNTLPKYSILKLSPTCYQFKISDANNSYVLILLVNYNRSWIAKINGEILSNHFPINGFANAWLVDKLGSYSVNVCFKTWPWE